MKNSNFLFLICSLISIRVSISASSSEILLLQLFQVYLIHLLAHLVDLAGQGGHAHSSISWVSSGVRVALLCQKMVGVRHLYNAVMGSCYLPWTSQRLSLHPLVSIGQRIYVVDVIDCSLMLAIC